MDAALGVAIITGVTGILSILIVQVFTLLSAREQSRQQREATIRADELLRQAQIAAVKTEEVRTTLKYSTKDTTERLKEIKSATEILKVTTDQVHTLVNSRLGAVLTNYAVTMRTLADLTGDPRHGQLARAAEEAATAHEKQNEIVDENAK